MNTDRVDDAGGKDRAAERCICTSVVEGALLY